MKNRTFKKVDFSKYEGKYDESIKERLAKNPHQIDIETMRANLYGYTFTPDYAKMKIPDEFYMDYWEELYNNGDFLALEKAGICTDFEEEPLFNESFEEAFQKRMNEDIPVYNVEMPQEELILKTIDSTGDGKSPKTALCVIDVHQEHEYMRRVFPYSELEMSLQSVRNGIDCITFKPNIYGIENLYFDISCRFDVGYNFGK